MKRIAITLIFSTVIFNSWAQGLDIFKEIQDRRRSAWDSEKFAKTSSFGIGYIALKNTNFSENKYGGLHLVQTFGKIIDRKAYTRWVQNEYSGVLLSKVDPEKMIIGGHFNRHNAYFLAPKNKLQLGLNLHTFVDARVGPSFENNALGGEIGLNLGPRLLYRTDTEILNQKFKLEYHLSTGILGFITSLPSPVVSIDQYANSSISQPFNYQSVQSGLFLNWQHKRRFPMQYLRLGYTWNYMHYAMDYGKDLFLATHAVHISGSLNQIK
jgi:hypothetical protein